MGGPDLEVIGLDPPQLASHRGIIVLGVVGKWRKAESAWFVLVEKQIPRDLEPFT